MLAFQMPQVVSEQEAGDLTTAVAPTPQDAAKSATLVRQLPNDQRQPRITTRVMDGKVVETALPLRSAGQSRRSNYEIGRAAEIPNAASISRPRKPVIRAVGRKLRERAKSLRAATKRLGGSRKSKAKGPRKTQK